MKIKSRTLQDYFVGLIFIVLGVFFFILSYLCFRNIIPAPGWLNDILEKLDMNTSWACEYWWSWLLDFPPQGICIALYMPRNMLYKPFFVIGIGAILIEIIREL